MYSRFASASLALAPLLSGAGFDTQPVVERNPNPAAPLAAIVRFTTASPVETTVTVSEVACASTTVKRAGDNVSPPSDVAVAKATWSIPT